MVSIGRIFSFLLIYDTISAMKITASHTELSGTIQVPGSKSHTIRALLLASLAEGTSHISNPLPSADCLSTSRAVPLIGAKVDLGAGETNGEPGKVWTVVGAGKNVHLPEDVVNVGDSGSLLYFMSPIAATFAGWSVFTGDESIRKRPVNHVVDALRQLGAEAYITRPQSDSCPVVIKGPIDVTKTVTTDGRLSQYVSGMMMAASRLNGTLHIELTDPKETPYLTMTKKWLESVGVQSTLSEDFKHITVKGPVQIKAFDKTIPSDWEAVAFPLIAALVTNSEITITNVDGSGTQGDDAIVSVLQSLGADITWNKKDETLTVRGLKKAHDGVGRLTTENLPNKELHVNVSGFPDAVCALAVIACFTEGTTYIEDAGVCRRKETDRLVVMREQLTKLGASVEEGKDFLVIHGHALVNKDGAPNKAFPLHGGAVDTFNDHRVAMSLACLGLGLPKHSESGCTQNECVVVHDAECCAVSFPHFFEKMNTIGADFKSE
jgi:3-phosphoshikimate 1-carboxyvinyltransferase